MWLMHYRGEDRPSKPNRITLNDMQQIEKTSVPDGNMAGPATIVNDRTTIPVDRLADV